MTTTKEQAQVPLYLKAWLTSKCHVELIVTGEFDPEAFEKLSTFLGLAVEIWRPTQREEANINSEGDEKH